MSGTGGTPLGSEAFMESETWRAVFRATAPPRAPAPRRRVGRFRPISPGHVAARRHIAWSPMPRHALPLRPCRLSHAARAMSLRCLAASVAASVIASVPCFAWTAWRATVRRSERFIGRFLRWGLGDGFALQSPAPQRSLQQPPQSHDARNTPAIERSKDERVSFGFAPHSSQPSGGTNSANSLSSPSVGSSSVG